ncbi:hypothetical protein PO124_13825 [Bacillus licheniformis]|nr:hypothetical protein [Bacillus licheniformis]
MSATSASSVYERDRARSVEGNEAALSARRANRIPGVFEMRELGMLTRPLGDVVAFLPPLASTADDLRAMVSIMKEAIQEVTGRAY